MSIDVQMITITPDSTTLVSEHSGADGVASGCSLPLPCDDAPSPFLSESSFASTSSSTPSARSHTHTEETCTPHDTTPTTSANKKSPRSQMLMLQECEALPPAAAAAATVTNGTTAAPAVGGAHATVTAASAAVGVAEVRKVVGVRLEGRRQVRPNNVPRLLMYNLMWERSEKFPPRRVDIQKITAEAQTHESDSDTETECGAHSHPTAPHTLTPVRDELTAHRGGFTSRQREIDRRVRAEQLRRGERSDRCDGLDSCRDWAKLCYGSMYRDE
eukprot:GDKI01031697.1.p1 GENE.GDKI01031697.1~~GDKI01031697.1.p1  ORF type:complete len:273 (-),score=54.15 GDKI01031697.1:43-861(-)